MCLKKIENASVALSALALVLFVANAFMIMGAQATQQQIAVRNAQVQDGVKLANLNNEVIRALGTAVVQNKDEKIKKLLSDNGITIQQQKAADTAAPAEKTDKK